MEIFKMFGTIFLKDEASKEFDGLEKRGRNLSESLGDVTKFAAKAGLAIGAIGSASSGAVAASAPLLAGVGGLAASFASAGIGAAAFGAVAIGALAPVIEGAENLTEAQQVARNEFESFQSFWGGFVKQFETPVFDIFGQALTMIKSVLTGLAPTITNVSAVISELFTGMNESINNGGLKPFFEWMETNAAESLNNFATITGNVFSGFFGLLQAFTPLGASMEEGIVRLTEKFAAWANSLSENPAFQNFIEYVKTNAPTLMDTISNLWTIISEAVTALAPLGETVLGILQTVTDKIVELMPNFESIVTYANDFANAIIDNWGTIEPIIVGLGIAVGTFLGIMKGLQIIGAINALMIAFRAGTVTATLAQWGLNAAMLANPITWIVALIALLVAAGVLLYQNWDVVKAKMKELWENMKEKWNQIKETVKTKIEEIKNNMKQKWEQIKSDTKAKIEEMKNTAKQKFADMVNAIRDKANEIKDKVKAGIDKVKSFLEGIDLSQMGKDMIQGLIDGIGSMGKQLVEKAKGVVNSAIEGAKALLKINSPSRVFMGIGESTGEGMAIGIENSKSMVSKASKGLATTPIQAMGSASASGGSSSDALLRSVQTMLENFRVDLHMNAELVGSGVAPTVSNRQGESISRKKFFAGGDKK